MSSKDFNKWNRINKRDENESGSLIRVVKKGLNNDENKWERIVKKKHETDEDEEDEELEENDEEYVDNCAETHEEEFSNESDGIDLNY